MIPRIVHQIWAGPPVKGIQECIDSVKKHNVDVDYRLYSEEDLPFPDLGIVPNSDYLRLEKLYEEGGYYIDVDCYCFQPLDFDRGLTFGQQETTAFHPKGLVEWAMGCEPKDPTIKKLLDATKANLMVGHYQGCSFWKEMAEEVKFKDTVEADWAGSRYFGKVNRSFIRPKNPTLVHLFLTSWVDTLIYKWPPDGPFIAGWPISEDIQREVEVIKNW